MKRKVLFIIVLTMTFVLTSCYYCETKNINEYAYFHQKMQKESEFAGELLPEIDDFYLIKDMYLYYNDKDLIDTTYVIYLKCEYVEERYKAEVERLSKLIDNEQLIAKDSDSFDNNSFVYTEGIDQNYYNKFTTVRYEYVLLDGDSCEVVYVLIFEDALFGKSVNIPEKYLPKELVDLRKTS